ncbi:MAG: glycosyltransferase [Phycisphaerales bacterium]|nr:MAG: glycosyltransferase [Phycisphaerales bacterium]
MLSVIVLSFNRRDALGRTLDSIDAWTVAIDRETIVVDNASTDGTSVWLREARPGVNLIDLEENVGVEGFNIGARAARGETLLILDDDAHVDEPTLLAALAWLLDASAGAPRAGVAFAPVHPSTRVPEWPGLHEPTNHWPAMGCANLIRADAWTKAGGYCPAFFLYRNDTDLALTIRGLGMDLHADPEWIAWHDSPAAKQKSARWHTLATRNWIWMTRRHARGLWILLGGTLGVVWAHRLAGWNLSRHVATLRGTIAGLFRNVPPVSAPIGRDGEAYRSLIRHQLRARGRATRECLGTSQASSSSASSQRHSA